MITIFWYVYLGLLALAAFVILLTSYKKPLGLVDVGISIITWIGLYGYVTTTQILIPHVWKVVFVIGLIWDVYFCFKQFNEEVRGDNELPQTFKLVIIPFILIFLVGPLYFGLFHYAF